MPTSIRLILRLEHLAEVAGRSKSFYPSELMMSALEDLEDLQSAERELDAVRTGSSKVYTLDEAEKRLGR
ncbi:CopG family transcriptional regulator [Achromobacter seleniivolatilans]|uniref:CopG family transcriptional regulator n=1 Tax=Achromobacter seleniivolatilans TaxID=3047478 RepID=A0ABY9LYQ6_9BURK|nr:CopG family transcriptional regulator [Achromobacter sp. R39]WMD19889.1 CopG family transcriptional regulator [Achromobacter sp. R39]